MTMQVDGNKLFNLKDRVKMEEDNTTSLSEYHRADTTLYIHYLLIHYHCSGSMSDPFHISYVSVSEAP